MTYGELNAKANVIARQLREKGVKPGDYVALMAERSMELVVGIYGIIKSGGAYVPIDTQCPKERLSYMLRDCAAKAILVYRVDVDINDLDIPVINLGDSLVYEGDETNLEVVNQHLDPLYLMYTSGTTGQPKGVIALHQGTVNLIHSIQKHYPIDTQAKILQKTAYTFDVSIADIFRWGLMGASAHVLSPGDEKEPAKMCEAIEKYQLTEMQIAPSMLKVFLDQVAMDSSKYGAMLKSLRYVFSCGEALPVKCVKDFYQLIGPHNRAVKLINAYGPTETSVFSTYYDCEPGEETVLIGKPIDNYQTYILDGTSLCGVGMIGELCIAGDGMTMGYLNNEVLTNEKFIDNPFGVGKLYRTGDMARWQADGNIDYLGRIDEQVKLRGYRIELGEIASNLRNAENITDAVVVVQTDVQGEQVLCAYIKTDELALDVEGIQAELRKNLPDYMIPSHYMKIEEFPVTSSGKLNKRALPKIEIKTTKKYVAPTTETEEIIVRIFEEMFSTSPIGIKESFFELGGNSLKATLLVNQIEQASGVRLGIIDIFQGVTVEGISLALENLEGSYEPIPKAEEKEYYPMSSAQRRLFVLDQLEDAGVAYNMPTVLMIKGKLNVEQAEAAFNELVQRHEALRTSFGLVGAEPVQYIHENAASNVVYKELTQGLTKAHMMEEFIRPFDLSKAPLIRAEIVKVEAENHVLLLDMHHIISDRISTEILMSDFLSLYAGKKLPELGVQYKDYTEWMLKRDLSEQKEYWLGQYEDEVPVLELPIDYSRPTIQSFAGATLVKKLNKHLKDQVKRLSERTGSTEYMVLLAMFMMLLGKYSNQEDVVVGTPISGRTHKDTENMVGMFVNTLVMRGKPEKEKTLIQFIEEVKGFCLQAYENQEYPFEELVEELKLPRDMSRNPLFDVMFSLDAKMEQADMTIGGIQLEAIENEDMDTISKFDLSLSMREAEDGYEAAFEYCSDLFKAETIELMAERFAFLLEEAEAQSERKIREIEVVLEGEKEQILTEFNATEMTYPKDKTVVELFEEQAKKAPGKIAMIFEETSMTYGELNAKANVLARQLREMGVKPGDYVALMTERSMELVVGIYGIIKSGGAYVPIDTQCPKERLSYMLTDCEAKAILVYGVDVDMSDLDIPVINLADSSVYEGNDSNLPAVNQHADPLYLLYTSGTTGQPKGVIGLHQGTVNLIHSLQKNYPIDGQAKILQKTAYTFDVSIADIFRWGLMGASAHVLSPGDEKEPAKMCEVIEAHQLTEMQIVPSMLKVFLAHVSTNPLKYGSMLKSLRYVFVAGEALPVSCVKDFYQLIGAHNRDVELINAYGPTETSVFSTYYDCKPGAGIVLIGKPIDNYQAYILAGTALCGIGMIGELCIAGVGVTKGYLNNIDLTNEKFIANPFGGGKLYRTGDMARWLADGNIEYMGRIDEQVKIRGFRIELGEIESVLRNVEGINDAVVIVQTNEAGDKALCAYVQTKDELDVEYLKTQLRNHLPDYMVPSHFMKIAEIPVTSSGKLNRRALPKIEITTTQIYVAPTTKTEEVIVRIFEEMFGTQPIGIKESFFDLGGNSLKATLLVNQIEQAMGVRLGIKDIFQGVTVEGIGLALENLDGNYEAIPKAEKKEFYPISPSQKLFFSTGNFGDYNAAEMTNNISMAFKVKGAYEVEKAQAAFETLLQRYEILRTSFHLINDEMVMRIHDQVKMEMIYEEHYTGEDFETFAHDVFRAFDLTKAPLMRVKVIKTGEEDFMLLMNCHHIISDGISSSLLLKEFMTLYTGGELAPPSLQYKDYSEWVLQRQLDDQQAYWTNHFANGIPKRLHLPEDYPRPKEKKFNGDVVVKTLDKKLSNKIVNISNKMDMTPFMTWLSMTMILFEKYSSGEGVVLGTTASGRTHRDTEDIQGVLVNRLLLDGKPEKEKSLVQFLEEVKENCLMAYENQDFPLTTLVQQFEPQAHLDKSRSPIYDVHYLYLDGGNEQFNEMDGLRFQAMEVKSKDAYVKFDLVCKFAENKGELTVIFLYCTDLFKKETIEGMMDQLIQILDRLDEDLDQTIEKLTSQI